MYCLTLSLQTTECEQLANNQEKELKKKKPQKPSQKENKAKPSNVSEHF